MEETADDAQSRLVFDVLSALALLLTALLGAYLPRHLSRHGDTAGTASSLAFHLGNMLSGGVMLSAGFCHLLADSLRQLAFIGRFPIATFLAAVGYLITLLADQVVTAITSDESSSSSGNGGGGGAGGHSYMRLDNQQQQQQQARQFYGDGVIELAGRQQQHGGSSDDGSSSGWTAQQQQAAHGGSGRGAAKGGGAAAPGGGSIALLSLGLPGGGGAAAAAAAADGSSRPAAAAAAADVALCVVASGSPRAITAASTHARTRTWDATAAEASGSAAGNGLLPADALQGQQQQQQQHGAEPCCNGGAQQQLCSQPCAEQPRIKGQQQQRQQRYAAANGSSGAPVVLRPWQDGSDDDDDDSGWAAGACLEQPAAAVSSSACGGCSSQGCPAAAGGSCSKQQHHAECMTEAAAVGRAAEHLELEMGGGAHNHAHFQVFLSQRPLSFATTVLLACALCIHSVLEGVALGAQQSMQSTRDIMLAIAAHKGLAAYALGASIVESKASAPKFWAVVSLFSAATPAGIGLGYAFSAAGHGSVSAAMSALASGTFLYVALNEVIPRELEHPGHRLAKIAALLTGFGLMSLLAVWA